MAETLRALWMRLSCCLISQLHIPYVIKGKALQPEFSVSVRVISYEEGKALAESWNAAFLESSAKENQVRGF